MPSMTPQQAFDLALGHHQAGRLAEAEAIYRQILAVAPRHADALHLLGVVAHQVGRSEAAVVLIQQAIEVSPTSPTFHSNLGEAYRRLDRLDEAIAAYRRAIQLRPDAADAHYNLGNALREKGQLEEAAAAFQQALRLQPEFVPAHGNLGAVLHAQGRIDEALAAYRRVIELQPGKAEAYLNLGSALRDLGQLAEAIAAYRQALRLQPAFTGAHYSLGCALKEEGHGAEAIEAFRRALELQPDFAEAHNNLGSALKDQGQLVEAIIALRTALQLDPSLVMAHSNLLLDLHYLPDIGAEEIFQEHQRWEEIHARPLAQEIEPHPNDPRPERRLRIGYVSPDFRTHPVACFFENLLANHDRGTCEVYCYADLWRADAVTARLRGQAAHWREITGKSDAQVAKLIREDRIDILVDLAGHTAGGRPLVFARKPAPVQVTCLGYCDTTGLRTMDYRLTDSQLDPAGATEHHHTERLVRLPETFACFRPADESPPICPRPAQARGTITFASFHALAKLNEPLLALWATILQQVPGARLRLAAGGFEEDSCRQRYSEFFAGRGIGAERLEFVGWLPLARYLAMHGEVDVLLDSHPFSGHTVGCHALWMGVPVVTLAGARTCSRMVTSVLASVGLPELVAHTPAQYVEIACGLARDATRLAALRAGLRERLAASPLLDGPRFARNVELAYREMWRTWCVCGPAHE